MKESRFKELLAEKVGRNETWWSVLAVVRMIIRILK